MKTLTVINSSYRAFRAIIRAARWAAFWLIIALSVAWFIAALFTGGLAAFLLTILALLTFGFAGHVAPAEVQS